MAEVSGIEIPKGSPGDLRGAAEAWSALADVLREQVGRLDGAASAAVQADWSGDASRAYAGTSANVAITMLGGIGACDDAADAARAFAHALRDAQRRAREARTGAEHAIARRDATRREITDAEARIAGANTAAELAAHRIGVAGAVGPAGASALAAAQADAHIAGRAREGAAADLRRAADRLHDAERDLERARREGDDAHDDARSAARRAAHAFAAVASAAQPAPIAGAPVPVSLRGASPDAAGLNGGFGGPFHAPGRFGSPGAARAAQIARQRQAELDAAGAAKPRKGSILDGVKGYLNGATLGIVDLGGDKDSDRYRGGDVFSYVPITPTALAKDAGKGGARLLGRLGRDAPAPPRRFKPTHVLGRKVYQRDDLIDPLKTDRAGRTNLERMADGDAPIGPDGKTINVHHTIQTDDGPLAELTQRFHVRHRRILHVNWPPKDFPSGIDRPAFDAWRKRYWKERGLDFPGDSG